MLKHFCVDQSLHTSNAHSERSVRPQGSTHIVTAVFDVGGTAVSSPRRGIAETHPSGTRGAPKVTEAQGTTESLVEGGTAAEAGAQTQVVERGAKRVGLVGSQQPHPMWLGTPPLLLLQVGVLTCFVVQPKAMVYTVVHSVLGIDLW